MYSTVMINAVYMTILILGYSKAQETYSLGKGYTIFNYFHDETRFYKELARVKIKQSRLRGGEEEKNVRFSGVYPKELPIR